jgi:uncharacterized membrane protein
MPSMTPRSHHALAATGHLARYPGLQTCDTGESGTWPKPMGRDTDGIGCDAAGGGAASASMNGQTSLARRVTAAVDWLAGHWLLIACAVLAVFVVTAWLAPVFMHLGWEGPAKAIYFVYGFFCHQLPERSWFLFGDRFTLPLADIQRLGNLSNDVFDLRRFIGSADVGWKVAWSDRMVSFYGGWFLFGLVYALARRRTWGLAWKTALVLLIPMLGDGVTHSISDLWGLGQGFRETNGWLVALTGHVLTPSFYSGDAWGSFNSLMRLGTGLLAAFAVIFFVFPLLNRAIAPSPSEAAHRPRESVKIP